MKAIFPRILAGLLALSLLLTAETMAMARGANPVADEIILCTGHGPQHIFVDADGAPTMGGHICPDCLTFFAAFAGETRLAPLDRALDARLEGETRVILRPLSADVETHARAPPVVV